MGIKGPGGRKRGRKCSRFLRDLFFSALRLLALRRSTKKKQRRIASPPSSHGERFTVRKRGKENARPRLSASASPSPFFLSAAWHCAAFTVN